MKTDDHSIGSLELLRSIAGCFSLLAYAVFWGHFYDEWMAQGYAKMAYDAHLAAATLASVRYGSPGYMQAAKNWREATKHTPPWFPHRRHFRADRAQLMELIGSRAFLIEHDIPLPDHPTNYIDSEYTVEVRDVQPMLSGARN